MSSRQAHGFTGLVPRSIVAEHEHRIRKAEKTGPPLITSGKQAEAIIIPKMGERLQRDMTASHVPA